MKIVSSLKVKDYKIFSVSMERAVASDGFEIERAVVQHPGSAVMMAVDAGRRILLVQQFRVPARRMMWELPAGRLDPGEMPIDAARRELQEETGYTAAKWTELVSFYPSPGFLSEKMTIFLAEDLTEGEQQLMGDERIRLRWHTTAEVRRMIRQNEIRDGKTMVAFLWWRQFVARR